MTNDKDQILVNQFIEDLDKVSREMQPLDENDNIGYVLITKLKRVYEVYNDTVLSNNDFDYLIDYYSHLQTKDEENQNPIPLIMQLSKHKKMIDTAKVQSDKKEDKEVKNMKVTCTYKTYSLDITKEDGSDYFRCILIGGAYSTPRKISNESLEKVLHIYKCHIDSFNTGILGHLMELTVKCGERTLDTFKYDPNINKVLGNFLFIVKKGEEGSLDKLVVSFQKDVDKESPQSVYTGIYFEYKGLSTKVEQLNCVNEDRYSCSDGRLKGSTIPKLYEKFKNKIDS